jgi:hypothetical protein
MKVYAFTFVKTHGANHWCKSSLLANHENEIFYFAFTGGARPPLLLPTFALPEILPFAPQIFPYPLALTFPFFFSFFFFFTSLINKSIKIFTTSKK